MPINQTNSAFRTKPCRYFADTGVCLKGAHCTFTHIDADGHDLHQSFILNDLDQDGWQEMQEDPAGMPDGFEEIDLNEVGAKEELCDEKDESSRLPPHFGNYRGIGS